MGAWHAGAPFGRAQSRGAYSTAVTAEPNGTRLPAKITRVFWMVRPRRGCAIMSTERWGEMALAFAKAFGPPTPTAAFGERDVPEGCRMSGPRGPPSRRRVHHPRAAICRRTPPRSLPARAMPNPRGHPGIEPSTRSRRCGPSGWTQVAGSRSLPACHACRRPSSVESASSKPS